MKPLTRAFAALGALFTLAGLGYLVATRPRTPEEAAGPPAPTADDSSASSAAPSAPEKSGGERKEDARDRTEPESEAEQARRAALAAFHAECSYWSSTLEKRMQSLHERPDDLEAIGLLGRDAAVALLLSQKRFEERAEGRSYPLPAPSTGHEIRVAGRFGTRAFLIPPGEFPEYWEVLGWYARPEEEQRDPRRAEERLELSSRVEALALLARQALEDSLKEF